jgi:hypothetical protein
LTISRHAVPCLNSKMQSNVVCQQNLIFFYQPILLLFDNSVELCRRLNRRWVAICSPMSTVVLPNPRDTLVQCAAECMGGSACSFAFCRCDFSDETAEFWS